MPPKSADIPKNSRPDADTLAPDSPSSVSKWTLAGLAALGILSACATVKPNGGENATQSVSAEPEKDEAGQIMARLIKTSPSLIIESNDDPEKTKKEIISLLCRDSDIGFLFDGMDQCLKQLEDRFLGSISIEEIKFDKTSRKKGRLVFLDLKDPKIQSEFRAFIRQKVAEQRAVEDADKEFQATLDQVKVEHKNSGLDEIVLRNIARLKLSVKSLDQMPAAKPKTVMPAPEKNPTQQQTEKLFAKSAEEAGNKVIEKITKKTGLTEDQVRELFDVNVAYNQTSHLAEVAVAPKNFKIFAASEKEAIEKVTKMIEKKTGLTEAKILKLFDVSAKSYDAKSRLGEVQLKLKK